MPPNNTDPYGVYIRKARELYPKVPEALIRAFINQESGGNARARSPKGAGGLMQLMPSTAKSLGVTDVYDPEQNILGGVKYLDQIGSQVDYDPELMAYGYHAGPKRALEVKKTGQKLGPSVNDGGIATDDYVQQVTNRFQALLKDYPDERFAQWSPKLNQLQPTEPLTQQSQLKTLPRLKTLPPPSNPAVARQLAQTDTVNQLQDFLIHKIEEEDPQFADIFKRSGLGQGVVGGYALPEMPVEVPSAKVDVEQLEPGAKPKQLVTVPGVAQGRQGSKQAGSGVVGRASSSVGSSVGSSRGSVGVGGEVSGGGSSDGRLPFYSFLDGLKTEQGLSEYAKQVGVSEGLQGDGRLVGQQERGLQVDPKLINPNATPDQKAAALGFNVQDVEKYKQMYKVHPGEVFARDNRSAVHLQDWLRRFGSHKPVSPFPDMSVSKRYAEDGVLGALGALAEQSLPDISKVSKGYQEGGIKGALGALAEQPLSLLAVASPLVGLGAKLQLPKQAIGMLDGGEVPHDPIAASRFAKNLYDTATFGATSYLPNTTSSINAIRDALDGTIPLPEAPRNPNASALASLGQEILSPGNIGSVLGMLMPMRAGVRAASKLLGNPGAAAATRFAQASNRAQALEKLANMAQKSGQLTAGLKAELKAAKDAERAARWSMRTAAAKEQALGYAGVGALQRPDVVATPEEQAKTGRATKQLTIGEEILHRLSQAATGGFSGIAAGLIGGYSPTKLQDIAGNIIGDVTEAYVQGHLKKQTPEQMHMAALQAIFTGVALPFALTAGEHGLGKPDLELLAKGILPDTPTKPTTQTRASSAKDASPAKEVSSATAKDYQAAAEFAYDQMGKWGLSDEPSDYISVADVTLHKDFVLPYFLDEDRRQVKGLEEGVALINKEIAEGKLKTGDEVEARKLELLGGLQRQREALKKLMQAYKQQVVDPMTAANRARALREQGTNAILEELHGDPLVRPEAKFKLFLEQTKDRKPIDRRGLKDDLEEVAGIPVYSDFVNPAWRQQQKKILDMLNKADETVRSEVEQGFWRTPEGARARRRELARPAMEELERLRQEVEQVQPLIHDIVRQNREREAQQWAEFVKKQEAARREQEELARQAAELAKQQGLSDAEREALRQQAEEAKRQAEEAKRQAEIARQQEREAKRLAEEARKREAEEAKRRQTEERQRLKKEEEKRRRIERENAAAEKWARRRGRAFTRDEWYRGIPMGDPDEVFDRLLASGIISPVEGTNTFILTRLKRSVPPSNTTTTQQGTTPQGDTTSTSQPGTPVPTGDTGTTPPPGSAKTGNTTQTGDTTQSGDTTKTGQQKTGVSPTDDTTTTTKTGDTKTDETKTDETKTDETKTDETKTTTSQDDTDTTTQIGDDTTNTGTKQGTGTSPTGDTSTTPEGTKTKEGTKTDTTDTTPEGVKTKTSGTEPEGVTPEGTTPEGTKTQTTGTDPEGTSEGATPEGTKTGDKTSGAQPEGGKGTPGGTTPEKVKQVAGEELPANLTDDEATALTWALNKAEFTRDQFKDEVKIADPDDVLDSLVSKGLVTALGDDRFIATRIYTSKSDENRPRPVPRGGSGPAKQEKQHKPRTEPIYSEKVNEADFILDRIMRSVFDFSPAVLKEEYDSVEEAVETATALMDDSDDPDLPKPADFNNPEERWALAASWFGAMEYIRQVLHRPGAFPRDTLDFYHANRDTLQKLLRYHDNKIVNPFIRTWEQYISPIQDLFGVLGHLRDWEQGKARVPFGEVQTILHDLDAGLKEWYPKVTEFPEKVMYSLAQVMQEYLQSKDLKPFQLEPISDADLQYVQTLTKSIADSQVLNLEPDTINQDVVLAHMLFKIDPTRAENDYRVEQATELAYLMQPDQMRSLQEFKASRPFTPALEHAVNTNIQMWRDALKTIRETWGPAVFGEDGKSSILTNPNLQTPENLKAASQAIGQFLKNHKVVTASDAIAHGLTSPFAETLTRLRSRLTDTKPTTPKPEPKTEPKSNKQITDEQSTIEEVRRIFKWWRDKSGFLVASDAQTFMDSVERLNNIAAVMPQAIPDDLQPTYRNMLEVWETVNERVKPILENLNSLTANRDGVAFEAWIKEKPDTADRWINKYAQIQSVLNYLSPDSKELQDKVYNLLADNARELLKQHKIREGAIIGGLIDQRIEWLQKELQRAATDPPINEVTVQAIAYALSDSQAFGRVKVPLTMFLQRLTKNAKLQNELAMFVGIDPTAKRDWIRGLQQRFFDMSGIPQFLQRIESLKDLHESIREIHKLANESTKLADQLNDLPLDEAWQQSSDLLKRFNDLWERLSKNAEFEPKIRQHRDEFKIQVGAYLYDKVKAEPDNEQARQLLTKFFTDNPEFRALKVSNVDKGTKVERTARFYDALVSGTDAISALAEVPPSVVANWAKFEPQDVINRLIKGVATKTDAQPVDWGSELRLAFGLALQQNPAARDLIGSLVNHPTLSDRAASIAQLYEKMNTDVQLSGRTMPFYKALEFLRTSNDSAHRLAKQTIDNILSVMRAANRDELLSEIDTEAQREQLQDKELATYAAIATNTDIQQAIERLTAKGTASWLKASAGDILNNLLSGNAWTDKRNGAVRANPVQWQKMIRLGVGMAIRNNADAISLLQGLTNSKNKTLAGTARNLLELKNLVETPVTLDGERMPLYAALEKLRTSDAPAHRLARKTLNELFTQMEMADGRRERETLPGGGLTSLRRRSVRVVEAARLLQSRLLKYAKRSGAGVPAPTPSVQSRARHIRVRGDEIDDGIIQAIRRVAPVIDQALTNNLLQKHQIQGVARALIALDPEVRAAAEAAGLPVTTWSARGFGLFDGAGVGKTREILAISKHFMDKGHLVIASAPLSVLGITSTPSKGTFSHPGLASSFYRDATALGIPFGHDYQQGGGLFLGHPGTPILAESGIYILPSSTQTIGSLAFNYLSRIPKSRLGKTLLILDESQQFKNVVESGMTSGSATSQAVNRMVANVQAAGGAVIYSSATPGDKFAHLEYLQVTQILDSEVMRAVGITAPSHEKQLAAIGIAKNVDSEKHVVTYELADRVNLLPGAEAYLPPTQKPTAFDRLAANLRLVFKKAESLGRMVARELPFDELAEVRVNTTPVDLDAKPLWSDEKLPGYAPEYAKLPLPQALAYISNFYDKHLPKPEDEKDNPQKAIEQREAFIYMQRRGLADRYKGMVAAKRALEELAKGRKVVIFIDRVRDGLYRILSIPKEKRGPDIRLTGRGYEIFDQQTLTWRRMTSQEEYAHASILLHPQSETDLEPQLADPRRLAEPDALLPEERQQLIDLVTDDSYEPRRIVKDAGDEYLWVIAGDPQGETRFLMLKETWNWLKQAVAPGTDPDTLVNIARSARLRDKIFIPTVYRLNSGEEPFVMPGTGIWLTEYLNNHPEVIGVGNIFGGGDNNVDAMLRFQTDDIEKAASMYDVVIATPQSGGAGINLDDKLGIFPRTVIYTTPPFAGDVLVQAASRTVRLDSASTSKLEYLKWEGGIFPGDHRDFANPDYRSFSIALQKLAFVESLTGSEAAALLQRVFRDAFAEGDLNNDPDAINQTEALFQEALVNGATVAEAKAGYKGTQIDPDKQVKRNKINRLEFIRQLDGTVKQLLAEGNQDIDAVKASQAIVAVTDAIAKSWAVSRNRSVDEWYASYLAGIEAGTAPPNMQKPAHAKVSFLDDGRAIITAFKSANMTSFIHELGHVLRRSLSVEDLKAIEEWAGVLGGQWTKTSEEKFARAWESYFRDHQLPRNASRELKKAFNWLGAIFRQVYRNIIGTPLEVTLSPELRKVFNDALAPYLSIYDRFRLWSQKFPWNRVPPEKVLTRGLYLDPVLQESLSQDVLDNLDVQTWRKLVMDHVRKQLRNPVVMRQFDESMRRIGWLDNDDPNMPTDVKAAVSEADKAAVSPELPASGTTKPVAGTTEQAKPAAKPSQTANDELRGYRIPKPDKVELNVYRLGWDLGRLKPELIKEFQRKLDEDVKAVQDVAQKVNDGTPESIAALTVLLDRALQRQSGGEVRFWVARLVSASDKISPHTVIQALSRQSTEAAESYIKQLIATRRFTAEDLELSSLATAETIIPDQHYPQIAAVRDEVLRLLAKEGIVVKSGAEQDAFKTDELYQEEIDYDAARRLAKQIADKVLREARNANNAQDINLEKLIETELQKLRARLKEKESAPLKPEAEIRIREKLLELKDPKLPYRQRQIKSAQIMQIAAEAEPSSLGKRLQALMVYSDLLNPPSILFNIGQDYGLAGTFFITDAVAALIDAGIGVAEKALTGKSNRARFLPDPRTMLQGYWRGLTRGIEDIRLGVDTFDNLSKRYALPVLPVFRSKFGKFLHNAMLMTYGVNQRAIFEAHVDESLRQSWLEAKNRGVKFLPEKPWKLDDVQEIVSTLPDDPEEYTEFQKLAYEHLERAYHEATYRAALDRNGVSVMLDKLRTVLNLPTAKVSPDFGLGNVVVTYAQVPGSVFAKALDWSPLGFGKALVQLARYTDKLAKTPDITHLDRRAIVDAWTRPLLGTGAMTYLGFFLYGLGLIVAPDKEEKDFSVFRAYREAGLDSYKLNVSGFQRFMRSWNPSDAQLREDDLLLGYDVLQPGGFLLTLGAALAENTKKQNSIATALINATETALTDHELIKGLIDLVERPSQKGGWSNALGATLANLPARFIPSLLKSVRKHLEPRGEVEQYDWRDPNVSFGNKLFANAVRKVIDSIPYSQKALEKVPAVGKAFEAVGVNPRIQPARTATGEASWSYPNATFWDWLSKDQFTRFKPTPETKYAMDLLRSLEVPEKGVKKQQRAILPIAPRVWSVNGKSYYVTADERVRIQEWLGKETVRLYNTMFKSENFKKLPPQEQARLIWEAIDAVTEQAKVKFLGHKPEQASYLLARPVWRDATTLDANAILAGKQYDETTALHEDPRYQALTPEQKLYIDRQYKNYLTKLKMSERDLVNDRIVNIYHKRAERFADVNLDNLRSRLLNFASRITMDPRTGQIKRIWRDEHGN